MLKYSNVLFVDYILSNFFVALKIGFDFTENDPFLDYVLSLYAYPSAGFPVLVGVLSCTRNVSHVQIVHVSDVSLIVCVLHACLSHDCSSYEMCGTFTFSSP